MADITVCLLSWKRPKNIPILLDTIKAQKVESRVFLWDNGEEPVEDDRIDWIVRSSVNMLCWPRWFMACQADTEYVCTLDDDLCFKDHGVLGDGIEALETLDDHKIVGPFGRILSPAGLYSGGSNVWGSEEDRETNWPVDVIKGRHMVVKTRILRNRLPMAIPPPPEDDIAVCGILAEGRRHQHVRPHHYGYRLQRFRELPANDAIWKKPDHLDRRDETARSFFSPGCEPPQPSSLRDRK
jgi:hypothetical protein